MRIESKVVGRYLVVKVLEPRLGADLAVNFKEATWKFVDQGQKSLVDRGPCQPRHRLG